jgi:hypothetical protein
MSDWENELDDEESKEKEDKKPKLKSKFDDESEEITVTKEVQKETIKQKDKPIDYEKKYNERKKEDIAIQKEIEESVKNIADPELRLKKKLELMQLKQAEKFIGETEETNDSKEEINLNFDLKVENDYIKLAQKSTAKINDAGKNTNCTLEFLKCSLENLLPTLDEDTIEELIKSIKIISTKKSKEKGGKNKKGKPEPKKEVKPEPKKEKFEERKALYKQYEGGEESNAPAKEEVNYYNGDDDDFM